jgi:hypothetical protein
VLKIPLLRGGDEVDGVFRGAKSGIDEKAFTII